MRAHGREHLIYAALAACIVAGALGLRLGALRGGFAVDDYAQLAMMRGEYPVPRAPLALFTFSNGAAAENRALMDSGFFPFWSHPQLRISMFRPLSSALMWVDLALFGLNAQGYQLHSLLWWLALLGLFAALVRKLLPMPAALLALALFAADESHGMLLGWIAMRNAVVASVFALLGLLLSLRARERAQAGRPAARWPALLAYACALLSGEYALAFVGYALLLELAGPAHHPSRSRLRDIAPLCGLLLAYFAARVALGFGAYASGMYVDPLAEPAEFLRLSVQRLPVLAGDLVFALRANFWTTGFPWTDALAARGLIPAAWVADPQPLRELQQAIGCAALVVYAGVGIAAFRMAGGRGARFLVAGVPLALLPLLSSVPESRNLAPAMVGFSVALAVVVKGCAQGLAAGKGRLRHALGLLGAALLAAPHLSLAPWFSHLDSAIGAQLGPAVRASILAPALDASLRSAERVLLLSAAEPTTTIYIPLVRRIHGRPGPATCQLLSSAFVPQRITRIAERVFTLERMLPGATVGDVYASAFNSRPLRAGQSFAVDGMRVLIEQVAEGHPLRTRYALDRSLDDPGVVLLLQTAAGLLRVPFPALGQSAILPPPVPPFGLMAKTP